MILLPLFEAVVAGARDLGDMALPAPPKGRLLVLGAGKAAAAMAQHVERHYGDRAQGFVVVPYGHGLPTAHIDVLEASHPAPDDESLRVGERMLAAAHALTAGDALLMLLSGGASSLAVVPRPGVSLAMKKAAARELLASGLPIHLINGIRKRLSAIKGGRLALAAVPAPVFTRIISDVPGDSPSGVGSGPTVADDLTTAEILDRVGACGVRLSDTLLNLLRNPGAEPPVPDDPRLPSCDCRVVMTAAKALAAAERAATAMGYDVINLGGAVEGEARVVARDHAALVRKLASEKGAKPLLILSGGETSVTVRGSGRGGRNTEYLLALGQALNGLRFSALAADTDGIDGNGTHAGAWLDDRLLAEAARCGLDLDDALARNDTLAIFEALQSVIVTGPTRTNVNDFRAVLLP